MKLNAATFAATLAAFLGGWGKPPRIYGTPMRLGKKPTGAARAKRAAKKRRNIRARAAK